MDERIKHHNFVQVDRQRHPQDYSVLEPVISKSKDEIASILLDIGCVKYFYDKPFELDSGILSPIYIDNRLILSNPYYREKVVKSLTEELKEIGLPDVVAGVATGGIPYAAIIADKLDLPMVYVRPQPKTHGIQNQIEGEIKRGQKVVIIEDSISTAGSSIRAIKALKEIGADVKDEIAIFTRGIKEADENLRMNEIKLHSLTDLESLIKVAQEAGFLHETQAKIISQWSEDPHNWGK